MSTRKVVPITNHWRYTNRIENMARVFLRLYENNGPTTANQFAHRIPPQLRPQVKEEVRKIRLNRPNPEDNPPA
jgi:hypothetical protein